MTCGPARRLLWPDGGPREATAEVVAARDHLSECTDCRRFLEDMQRTRDLIHQAMPRPGAPAEVRERLFKAVAEARTAGRRRVNVLRRWLAGLAAAAIVGGTWLGIRMGPERAAAPDASLRAVAEDHLRAQRTGGLLSSDSLEVARWLADRLPFAIDVPIFPDAELRGARLLLVNGQSGGVVEYRIAGRALSYYVLPARARASAAPDRQVRLEPHAGYQVAAWDDAGLTHALIAGLPGPKLVDLAHYCIAQMTAAVAI